MIEPSEIFPKRRSGAEMIDQCEGGLRQADDAGKKQDPSLSRFCMHQPCLSYFRYFSQISSIDIAD